MYETYGIDFNFIHDQAQNGVLHVAHVSFEDQLVDALIKPLPYAYFVSLMFKIGLSMWSSILQGIIKEVIIFSFNH